MDEKQKRILLSYLEDFQKNPVVVNEGVEESYDEFTKKRVRALEELRLLTERFLRDEMPLRVFKEQSELSCRQFPYWGFKGFSGQMQLNQYENNIADDQKAMKLRGALAIPQSALEAKDKIDTLVAYLEDVRSHAENSRSLPRKASMSYLLSYFWQIQDHQKWPVYYHSTKEVLENLGFGLAESGSFGQAYVNFVEIMHEIDRLYRGEKNVIPERPLWFIEHVLWKQHLKSKPRTAEPSLEKAAGVQREESEFGEWLPPVISDLDELAHNRETAWSRQNQLRPEKAFETKLQSVFTLLGYNTEELGQGRGRGPDGVAISVNAPRGDYGIVYDAKAREDRYSIGTNDREILEYVQRWDAELRRQRINRMYFIVVSSEFDTSENSMDRIRDILRRTRVPIIFLKAPDLLFILETKLQHIEIDHSVLEDLFLDTGVLTRERIVSKIGIR